MRVVVLGASGAIGRGVAQAVRAAGREVVAVVRDRTGIVDVDAAGFTIVEADPTDRGALGRALDGADAAISALGPTAKSAGAPFVTGG